MTNKVDTVKRGDEMSLSELISLASHVAFYVNAEDSESISVKGFASVQAPDRSGDYVEPNEFKVDQFMAAPTLLVNHTFVRDGNYNKVAAGRIEEVVPSELVKISGDTENWGVREIGKKKIFNTFPKRKVPNLTTGDRGLFVVAKVTEPGTVRQVKNGELSAFSWRGLSKIAWKKMDDNTVKRVLKDIDLFEISLVHVPDNPNATFILGKAVHQVRLEKERFESTGMAREFLKCHNLRFDQVREDDQSYYALQCCSSKLVDTGKVWSVKMSDGVHIITGEVDESKFYPTSEREDEKEITLIDSWLDSAFIRDIQKLKNVSEEEERIMGEETKVDDTKTAATTETVQKSADDKNKEQFDILAKTVAGYVVEGLKPCIETMANSSKSLETSIVTLVGKMAEIGTANKEEPKKENEEGKESASVNLEEIFKSLNKIADGFVEFRKDSEQKFQAQGQAVLDVAKGLKALSTVTPKEIVRTEEYAKTETSKEAKTEDKGKVFDSLFPLALR